MLNDISRAKAIVVETGVTAVTPPTGTVHFDAIFAVTDIVISTITVYGNVTGDTLNGITILAGTTVFLPFTAITLTSGKAIYYIC